MHADTLHAPCTVQLDGFSIKLTAATARAYKYRVCTHVCAHIQAPNSARVNAALENPCRPWHMMTAHGTVPVFFCARACDPTRMDKCTSADAWDTGDSRARAVRRAHLRTWHQAVRQRLYVHNVLHTCVVAKRMALRRAVMAVWARYVWCLRTADNAWHRNAARLLRLAWTAACEYGELSIACASHKPVRQAVILGVLALGSPPVARNVIRPHVVPAFCLNSPASRSSCILLE